LHINVGIILISGTIKYQQRDLIESRAMFATGEHHALWKATLAIALLGAVIGFGIMTLVSSLLSSEQSILSQMETWGAIVGSIALVTTGAWHISHKAESGQSTALERQQSFCIDDEGLRLTSETAESRMSWPHFVEARIEPEMIGLKTQEQTIVLLRPSFVADRKAWDDLRRIVTEHIDAAARR
jgi:hypothetical protein